MNRIPGQAAGGGWGAGKVKVAQSCPSLCDLRDYTVHGILQARILAWVAIPFSRESPNPGIKPRVPGLGLQVNTWPGEPPEKWGEDRRSQPLGTLVDVAPSGHSHTKAFLGVSLNQTHIYSQCYPLNLNIPSRFCVLAVPSLPSRSVLVTLPLCSSGTLFNVVFEFVNSVTVSLY